MIPTLQDLGAVSPLDIAAFGLMLLLWAGIGRVIEHPPANRASVSVLMAGYRREWMRQFVTRQPRIFDATVLDSLRQGTAFFASACMIAIGGGVALVGNPQQLADISAELPVIGTGVALEFKLVVVVAFLANALLKFIWAHRLFGYCAILMAAVPNETDDPAAFPRAAQAAEVNITAAKSFNRGLRSIYFALGALGWLLGPLALVVTATLASAVLVRREFASHSRQVMLGEGQGRS